MAAGFQPALSYKMKADHGFMTVYYELDRRMQLPMVPIIMNCTTPPLMTLRQCYDFGVAMGDAIRSYRRAGSGRPDGRGGGLSHFVGEPRVGDIDEQFDRWFLRQLESGDFSELFDMPNDELCEAGNGTGEVRAWVAAAGAAGAGQEGEGAGVRGRSTSGSTAWAWSSSSSEFAQHGVGEWRPHLGRPLAERAVGQRRARDARLRVDPEEAARLAEMSERRRRVP